MSTGKRFTALLLLSTALGVPSLALAQETAPDAGAEGQVTQGQAEGEDAAAEPDVSVPGGAIVVTGRRRQDITRSSSQVVTVLDAASIARTDVRSHAGPTPTARANTARRW